MVLIYRRELTIIDHGGFISYKIPIVEVYGGEKPRALIVLNLSKVYGKLTIIEDLWYIIRKLKSGKVFGRITFAYIARRFKQNILDDILAPNNYDIMVEVLLLGKSYPYLIDLAHNEKCDFSISKLQVNKESGELLRKMLVFADEANIKHVIYVASSSIKVNGRNSSELNYNALMNMLGAYGLVPWNPVDLKLISERFREVRILASRSKGGILLLKNKLGQEIVEGSLVYEIKNVFGELIDSMVFSGEKGIIISCTEKIFVKPYDYVVSIATV